MISHGSSLSAKNNDGNTPLHVAAENSNKIKLKYFQNQMKFNLFCILGNKKVAELLLSHGSDLSATNNKGQTPLSLAEKRGNKMIKYRRLQ